MVANVDLDSEEILNVNISNEREFIHFFTKPLGVELFRISTGFDLNFNFSTTLT